VRLSAAFRSVTATHLARDDGWAQRVLDAPVGRVDRVGLEKEGKHRWEFDGEMYRESSGHSGLARMIDDGVELILEMPARNRDAAGGDPSLLILVADPQRMVKDPLHAGAKRRSR